MTLKQRSAKARAQSKGNSTKHPIDLPDTGKVRSSAKPARQASVTFLLAQMLFCLVGINLCFGWWSVKQERVIKKPYFVSVSVQNETDADAADAAQHIERIFLTTAYGLMLSQTLTAFFVSAMLLGSHNIARRLINRGSAVSSQLPTSVAAAEGLRSPGKLALDDVPELLAMGFSNIFGSSLGYAGMRRLSYPVTLTAKMCKMLPVILIGTVWHHNHYPARKVLSCFLITGGVIAFALQDQRSGSASAPGRSNKTVDQLTTSSSSLLGIVLMMINLLLDGYTNSTQDVLVRRHRWSGPSLMMWTNLVSFCCALFVLALLEFGEQPWTWLCSFVDLAPRSITFRSAQASGNAALVSLSFVPFHDFSHFLSFLARSREARLDVLLMSVLNAVGQLFIFHTISVFGTLAVTAMTLLRKVGSVLLSIYVHGHSVQSSQWAALTTIFIGIVSEGYINVQDASRRHKQRMAAASADASPHSTVLNAKPPKTGIY